MPSVTDFSGIRSRGIVWVCDIANSSRHLNDDAAVADLEVFLQRFLFVSSQFVEAAGGQFIKWTGDGFLAWFETELHRSASRIVSTIFDAAWHLTVLTNLTKLGVHSKAKFKIRHGVTFEHDALLLNIKYSDGRTDTDLLGRGVVLAFRLSGIDAPFPGIVAQGELIEAHQRHGTLQRPFKRLRLSRDDRLRYLKGERWGAESLYVSSDKQPKASSRQGAMRNVQRALDMAAGTCPNPDVPERLEVTRKWVGALSSGPEWCQEALRELGEYIYRLERLLKEAVPSLAVLPIANRAGLKKSKK